MRRWLKPWRCSSFYIFYNFDKERFGGIGDYIWKSLGRHGNALELMESCVQTRLRILGPEHPYTLSSLAVLKEWANQDAHLNE